MIVNKKIYFKKIVNKKKGPHLGHFPSTAFTFCHSQLTLKFIRTVP